LFILFTGIHSHGCMLIGYPIAIAKSPNNH
jgi:hypothetical protein